MRKDARHQKTKSAPAVLVSAASKNLPKDPQEPEDVLGIEKMRHDDILMTNVLCILLIIGPTTACVVTFCITRNPVSLSPILILPSAISKLRHRLQIHLYPFSQEELQIELKDREVEIERIKKQSSLSSLTLFAWLRDLFKKEK